MLTLGTRVCLLYFVMIKIWQLTCGPMKKLNIWRFWCLTGGSNKFSNRRTAALSAVHKEWQVIADHSHGRYSVQNAQTALRCAEEAHGKNVFVKCKNWIMMFMCSSIWYTCIKHSNIQRKLLWYIDTNFHMFFSAIATNQTTSIYFPFCVTLVQDRTGCLCKSQITSRKARSSWNKERIVMISWAKALHYSLPLD